MRKGRVLWLFGPSGAGKTRLTKALLPHIPSVVLDGDHMRATVSKDLGFSVEDRTTHLERMAHIAKHLSDSCIDVICAFITPTDKMRNIVDDICKPHFVYVAAPLIREDSIFEVCLMSSWDVAVHPPNQTVEQSTNKILQYLNSLPLHFYMGRFQPFHEGHQYLIRSSIHAKIPVLIGVKDMLPDAQNPFPAEQVVQTIKDYYKDEDVDVITVPNITSINYGRKVGWDIQEIDVPDHISDISATKIRSREQLKY